MRLRRSVCALFLTSWLVAAPLRGQPALASDSSSRAIPTKHLFFGAMAAVVATRASPAYAGKTFTELQVIQPALMMNARWRAVSFFGTLNGEGYTLRRGELNAGIFGEGYVDRRHPHTFVHEALVVVQSSWPVGSTQTRIEGSLAAGRGFVPFGSDDPMMRPLEKYPVNHHYSQITERIQAVAGTRAVRGNQSIAFELSAFNGDEPAGPFHGPRWNRLGDSWAIRGTAQPMADVELSLSTARVLSPDLQQGGAFDNAQQHASLRILRLTHSGAVRYLLIETARTQEVIDRTAAFRYKSSLAEGAYGWRGALIALRLELTDRGEDSRLLDPFRTKVGHVDFQINGITQWKVATAGLQAPALFPHQLKSFARVMPFVEVARATPTAATRPTVFEPASFYGADQLWSLSVGLRIHAGTMVERMGRYGIMNANRQSGRMRHNDSHN